MARNAATGDSLKRRSPGMQARASDDAINLGIDYMSNAIKIKAAEQPTRARYFTPEDAFVAQPLESLDQIEDALSCALHRCKSQLHLMFVASENNELSGNDLSHSIWLLEGQLEQMHQMIRARGAGRVMA